MSDNNYDYIDLLPWKKTYSNPDGNGIIMEYQDVDFDHPIFENLSDNDITLFFNNYMKMLDNYFLKIIFIKLLQIKTNIFLKCI